MSFLKRIAARAFARPAAGLLTEAQKQAWARDGMLVLEGFLKPARIDAVNRLIEALSQGKAVVATSVTLQGVQEDCAPVLRPIDASEEFAAEIVALLGDATLRAARAAAALQVARERFSAEACHAGLLEYLRAGQGSGTARIRNRVPEPMHAAAG